MGIESWKDGGIRSEAGLRADAVLFWNGDGASFVYSGDAVYADFYRRVSVPGILSVQLLNSL